MDTDKKIKDTALAIRDTAILAVVGIVSLTYSVLSIIPIIRGKH